MREKISKIYRRYARRTLAAVLCLVAVFCAFPLQAFAATGLGYRWTRVKSAADMTKYYTDGKTDRDPKKYLVLDDYVKDNMSQMTSDSNQDHWFKVLIVYDDKYFYSGTSTCSDGECLSATRILPSYQMDVTKDSFETSRGYMAPYIRYAGTDKDNSQAGGQMQKYVLRAANSDDSMSSDVIAFNASWYGIKYAAAVYGEFRITNASSLSSSTHGAACSSTLHPDAVFNWVGDRVNLFYNLKGAVDRDWTYEKHDNKISMTKYPSNSECLFKIFIGSPKPVSQTLENLVISAGLTTTYTSNIFVQGVKVTVPKNATLVLEGLTQNNALIYVDGGTLIIRGNVDNDLAYQDKGNADSSKDSDIEYGSIVVDNGGLLYIENNGTLLERSNGSVLKLLNGSSCVIDGSCVVKKKIVVDNSSLSVRAGAALLLGVVPGKLTATECFGRSYILGTGKEEYLSTLVSQSQHWENLGTENAKQVNDGAFIMKNYASFVSDGLYFQGPNELNVWDTQTVYYDCLQATNINAKIKDMVRKW